MGNPRSDIREGCATSSPVVRTIRAENVRLLRKQDSGRELQHGEHDNNVYFILCLFFPPSDAAGELLCLNLISNQHQTTEGSGTP